MTSLPYRDHGMSDGSKYGRGAEDGMEGGEEEEEEEASSGYKSAKDAVLFAIDVSDSMLRKPAGGVEAGGGGGGGGAEGEERRKGDADALSPTVAALRCAYALMQQRIISHPSDMMGILLFGTEQSRFHADEAERGGLQYPHCYLLTPLDVPAAADVKHLRQLVEDEEVAAEVLVASKEEVSMANLLFAANQIFTTNAPNFASRRLFLVTDNDSPHATNRDARNSAAVRAKDLYDLGVTIDLFPISHPDRGYTFDRSKFYNDIVYSATPADPDAPAPLAPDIQPASSTAKDGISLLQSLLSSIASRSTPRRALISNLPFEIGPGLKISVKLFNILMRQEPKRTSYIYLPPDSDQPQIVVGKTILVADDTARSVERTEVRRAYKFGGETITFSTEEMARIKHFGDPVLRIIGFKPANMLPIWASLKPSTFMYPSEDDVVGSTRVFAALHHKLLASHKMGLAWFIPRRNATPTLAALLASPETRSPLGEQLMPAGIWIKPLPTADDIRLPPETHPIPSPDPLTDAMRTIIQQLQLPHALYDPRKYPNPSLQWFYRILQALALEEDLPASAEDKTRPRYRQIHKRAGAYVVRWGEELDAQFAVWQRENARNGVGTATGAVKRGKSEGAGGGEGEGAKAKRVRVKDEEGGAAGVSDAVVRQAYEKDALGKLTVVDLKAWLGGRGVKAVGKKADLIEAVARVLEKK